MVVQSSNRQTGDEARVTRTMLWTPLLLISLTVLPAVIPSLNTSGTSAKPMVHSCQEYLSFDILNPVSPFIL